VSVPFPIAELEPEERDAFLDRMAREVTRRRLEAPAILALEMHRPLMFLGSQALAVFTPMLAPAFGLENLQKLYRILEDRQNLDRFIERIEELAALRIQEERRPDPATTEPSAGE
jgi:hypothetical protein